jgi:glycosyltransferase involved in cell wall biosynthesis
MNNPLVSVIVPTKNSSEFLEACLKSIKNQSYKNIEILVVDNNSTDDTIEIAKRYTDKVFNKGPERSAQRNFGARQSEGEHLLFVDHDMELSEKVVEGCVEEITSNESVKALVIPEESFGQSFWAQCKKLERSFYVGVDWMEAARFFEKGTFEKATGYDENMISGEDWDLSQRIENLGKVSRIESFILHNEGRLSILETVRKKFYYARHFTIYMAKENSHNNIQQQTGIIFRYTLFLSHPKKLLQNPILGIAMLFMKTCEFGFGGLGYIIGRLKNN